MAVLHIIEVYDAQSKYSSLIGLTPRDAQLDVIFHGSQFIV